MQPVLQARNLVKHFGRVTALDGADFDLLPGEILAVIGDNGAGKSVMIKTLTGAIQLESGEIKLQGKPIYFNSPIAARLKGIETVYQTLALSPALSIADNMFMGRELRYPGIRGKVFRQLDKPAMEKFAREKLSELGLLTIQNIRQAVETLSGGQRQGVAVARATSFGTKLVIMDEPTAALAIKEVGKVLDLINGLKKIGVSVIIISHRMDDIFAVCDRVTALFQGTNFAESELSKTSRDEVIGWIMGKK